MESRDLVAVSCPTREASRQRYSCNRKQRDPSTRTALDPRIPSALSTDSCVRRLSNTRNDPCQPKVHLWAEYSEPISIFESAASHPLPCASFEFSSRRSSPQE